MEQHSVKGRQSIRLPAYDYSGQGGYFITTCTKDRAHLFGRIIPGCRRDDGRTVKQCNGYGAIVSDCWQALAGVHPNIRLDDYVVMPNHFHAILVFTGPVADVFGTRLDRAPKMSTRRNMALSRLIGRFKMQTAKGINRLRGTPGTSVWQRNYWEHVIRDEKEWLVLREYILFNPAKWEHDKLNDQRMDAHVHEPYGVYAKKIPL
jgi:REP element-mobilizing transposase RayT